VLVLIFLVTTSELDANHGSQWPNAQFAQEFNAPALVPLPDQLQLVSHVQKSDLTGKSKQACCDRGCSCKHRSGIPTGEDNDAANRDLVFQFGIVSEGHFTGNFAEAGAASASGFDKLGAYGFAAGSYRFFLDFDHDGVSDFTSVSEIQVSAIAVGGDFNAAHPGDEIGLFDGQQWYLDTDGDNVLEVADGVIPIAMRGLPFVGDFDGDGADDLATYDPGLNLFSFDLNRNGIANDTLAFGFNGFGERPLVGDMNLDGVDDLALWVTNREGQLPDGSAEWHVLVSDGAGGRPSTIFDAFSPALLGNDLFAVFGDDDALPILGNFDPPPRAADEQSSTIPLAYVNFQNRTDVDNDGLQRRRIVINLLNREGTKRLPLVRSSRHGGAQSGVDAERSHAFSCVRGGAGVESVANGVPD
jgi:hypothetical protein